MANKGQTAAIGMGVGALAGALGGPIGMMAGAGIGGTIGGMFGKDQLGGYSKGDIEYLVGQRQQQINSFSATLASARARYLAQLPQFQNYVMNRWLPRVEAQYAARGLQVGGGAFGSAVGNKASDLNADAINKAYDLERADMSEVEQMRNQLASAQIGGSYSNYAVPNNNFSQSMGMLSGQLLNSAMASYRDRSAPDSEYGGGYSGGTNPYVENLKRKGYSQKVGQWW